MKKGEERSIDKISDKKGRNEEERREEKRRDEKESEVTRSTGKIR